LTNWKQLIPSSARRGLLSTIHRFVGVFQVDAEIAMDASVAMDAKPESFFGNLIDDAIAELDNIFLKRFVACWVVQHFPDDSGVART
jgi:hypothetical protein